MKYDELKLGDKVLYRNKVIRIEELSLGCSGGLDESGIWTPIINEEELKPIPLTREILLGNGWKKSPYGQFYTKELFELREWDKQWNFRMRNGYNILSIVSVHQLQHILWAFGIDDDLKV